MARLNERDHQYTVQRSDCHHAFYALIQLPIELATVDISLDFYVKDVFA